MATLDSPPPGRSRVEEEIIEILERADRPPTVIDQVRGRTAFGQATLRTSIERREFSSWTPRAAIACAFLLAIASLLASHYAPLIAGFLAVTSFASLASLWFVRSKSPAPAPKWRGQDISRPASFTEWRSRWNLPRD